MMGLSDEERRSGMYYAVRGIMEAVDHWEEKVRNDGYMAGRYEKVRTLAKGLWHGLFGGQTNGLHWILGSSATNSITTDDPRTPWEMGVIAHCEKHQEDEDESVWKPKDNKPFNATEFCDIPYLLSVGDSDEPAAGVFKVYMWVEQLIYYLRRYNDDFVKNYEVVSQISSDILGECFNIFTRHEGFARAYLLHEIMEILYGPAYPYREEEYDIATRIMVEHNLHHDMPKWMRKPLTDLAHLHKHLEVRRAYAKELADRKGAAHKWSNEPELLKERLLIALHMGQSIYKYEHIQRDILKKVSNAPRAWRLLPLAKREMNETREEIEKEETGEKENTRRRRWERKDLNVYGWRAYEELDEHFKDEDRKRGIPVEED